MWVLEIEWMGSSRLRFAFRLIMQTGPYRIAIDLARPGRLVLYVDSFHAVRTRFTATTRMVHQHCRAVKLKTCNAWASAAVPLQSLCYLYRSTRGNLTCHHLNIVLSQVTLDQLQVLLLNFVLRKGEKQLSKARHSQIRVSQLRKKVVS